MLESAQDHQDWTIHDWYRVIFSYDIEINQFQSDYYTWSWVRMENLNYKLIMRVKELNSKVVQFCIGLYDFERHELHVQDRGEDDTSSSRWGHEDK